MAFSDEMTEQDWIDYVNLRFQSVEQNINGQTRIFKADFEKIDWMYAESGGGAVKICSSGNVFSASGDDFSLLSEYVKDSYNQYIYKKRAHKQLVQTPFRL